MPISKGEIIMEKRKFLSPAVALGAIAMALASCGEPTSSSTVPGGNSSESSSSVTPGSSSSSSSDSEEPAKAIPASGAQQFVDSSYEDRTEILGKIEKYAVDHAITGLPLYEDSGYQMINPRIVKGVNTYITGYGFSTLRDGYINGSLSGETDSKYQNYYHNWTSSDPGTIDVWNSDGSVVGDMHANIGATYYGTRLNEDKTGYEWYPILATQDYLWPVEGDSVNKNPNAEELHLTWRMHVRTGEAGKVTYRTASTKSDRAAFDNRVVTLEDYITPFKYMLNGANKLFRGNELASKTGKGAIVGVADYFARTAGQGVKGLNESVSFDDVGITSGTDDDGDYLEFTFQTPVNRFYAMYSVNSDMYSPLPKDFVKLVGTDLGNYSSDKSTSPVDNILSTGPFMLESWETDKLITYKTNDTWYEKEEDASLYRIGGIHTDVLTGYKDNKNIAFEQFLANKLDIVGIPSDYLEQYSTDARSVKVPGESVWKLNLNTCTPELWEQLFGENGTITHTSKDKYWNVKPWMSNENFIRGLFYSINRSDFANKMGGTPSINYFSDIYLSNPETGESYNSTEAHKQALENFWGSTIETYGYSQAMSQAAFSAAIDELLEDGSIKSSTKEISIDIWWMYDNQIDLEGALIASYITTAFNAAAEAKGLPVRLKINQSAEAEWDYVYYDHLMVGQFDLGFGSISGNSLDPLNFMEVLKSSNSSGFTLNWGADTTIVETGEDALLYPDKDGNMRAWSFDGLWDAADSGVILDEDGQAITPVTVNVTSIVESATAISIEGNIEVIDFDGLEIDLQDLYGTTDPSQYSDYFEVYPGAVASSDEITSISWDENEDGSVDFAFTLNGTLATNVKDTGGLYIFGIDFTEIIDGVYCGLKSSATSLGLPE